MRWTFTRGEETVICELGLNHDDTGYELRIEPPWNPLALTTELFDDAVSAFERQTEVEGLLVGDGWSLEAFCSARL
jgi:hypothetical protein